MTNKKFKEERKYVVGKSVLLCVEDADKLKEINRNGISFAQLVREAIRKKFDNLGVPEDNDIYI